MPEAFILDIYNKYENEPFDFHNEPDTANAIYDELKGLTSRVDMNMSEHYAWFDGEYDQYDIFMTSLYDMSERYTDVLFSLYLPATFTESECKIYIVNGRSYVQEAIIPEFDPFLMDRIGVYRL